jgi:tRNA threonylcarbamoyladenosine biosynthesis protein TsaB
MPETPAPLLLVDASTPTIHVGLLRDGAWLALERETGDALTLVFELALRAFSSSGLHLDDVGGFVFCEGPGGLLGLRLAAMAVETWRALPAHAGKPLLVYRSLTVASALCGSPEALLISPFRRGIFNVCHPGGALELLDAGELDALEAPKLFIPQRHLPQAPAGAVPFEYHLDGLPALLESDPKLFRLAERAEVHVPEEASYKLWSGERHRGER